MRLTRRESERTDLASKPFLQSSSTFGMDVDTALPSPFYSSRSKMDVGSWVGLLPVAAMASFYGRCIEESQFS